MFLKTLIISKENSIIREIPFHKGLNLIIDESENQVTGNNIGKTTVLRLIDFCFGGSPKQIYIDPETKKDEYKLVKDFLIDNKVIITLLLTEDLDDEKAETIKIERNFLSRKNIIRKINNKNYIEDEFSIELSKLIFPEHTANKPTFRQIISHNFRIDDLSLNNTLKTLDKYTSDAEYETLYLFLFGCDFTKGDSKQKILEKLKQENTYKNRLEKTQTKSAYETALALIENQIKILNEKKSKFNLNENFEKDLEKLNQVKYQINKLSSEINKINIRISLINESEQALKKGKFETDLNQLHLIYSQAANKIQGLQKTFDDLVVFHNRMLEEKSKFICKELPALTSKLKQNQLILNKLLQEENQLSQKITKSESFEELEKLIAELNENYRLKGEYESIIQQLVEVESNISELNTELNTIDNEIFSNDFENIVKEQLNKFNIHFASISNELYNEQFAVKADPIINRKKQRLYKFSAFNLNLSSGKKQGEISCFDIAYTIFADEENIPCLHFILNDKKELMHDNQLIKISDIVNKNNIQFVASILKDKLPDELNDEKYFVVKLSQNDKLFKIENE